VALEVRLPEGDIDIHTTATQETAVELTGIDEAGLLEIARIEKRDRGDVAEVLVEVRDRGGWSRFLRNRSLRLEVQAPDKAEVRIRTGSADTRARGTFGDVAVESGSGDISFDDVLGDAVVKTASGDVELQEVKGDAVVSTAAGDIEIEEVGGDARIRTASGDVRVGEANSDVSVQTASGDVQLDAVIQGEVNLQSASGDIVVGIRRGSRLAIDARSLSGDTSSELELDDVPIQDDDEGPLVELRATAMSGDIRVVRA
jgi:DUF4097 and DUF4098 domain-containing protein YvlB